MDKREYWTTKPSSPEYEAITFSHPAFSAPIRLVANQFAPVTLGGQVHTPAPMEIKTPDQSPGAQVRLTMRFPRAVVGREFKRQLALVAAAGSLAPITVLYALYLGDTAAPEVTRSLYVADAGGVLFGPDSVSCTATDVNPMRAPATLVYDPSTWTGLEIL
jgi:hypothetical protein